MDPQHYLRILRRRWKLILVVALAGATFGLVSALFVPEAPPPDSRYIAVHALLGSGQAGDGTAAAELEQARFLATSGEVPDRVAEQLGGDPLALAARIRATSNPQLGTVQIAAFGKDPDEVVQLADTFADELVSYMAERNQEELDETLEELAKDLEELESRYLAAIRELEDLPEDERALAEAKNQGTLTEITALETEIENLQRTGGDSFALRTVQRANAIEVTEDQLELYLKENVDPLIFAANKKVTTTSSLSSHPVVRTGIGGLLGLASGIVLALTLGRLDRRLHTKEEAEEAFGLPVLAEIPPLGRSDRRDPKVLSWEAPRSSTAEAHRALRSSLVYLGARGEPVGPETARSSQADPSSSDLDDDSTPTVIMVTSPGPAEGKTTTAANLAAVLGEAGLSVLVVNCDFRKPQIHRFLGGDPRPRRVHETAIPGVRLVSDVVDNADLRSPSEIISEQRRTIEHARPLFDVVLLDTAPLLATSDAIDLLPDADLVIIIARAGFTTRDAAERAAELLERHEARMAGAVLVGAQETPSSRYYYYRHYHDETRSGPPPPGEATPGGPPTSAPGGEPGPAAPVTADELSAL